MNSKERVFGYARISVSHEDLENQKVMIKKYCQEKGYDLIKIFEDTVTGITNPFEREAFRKMIEYARELGIHKVIIVDLTRLGRSVKEIFTALKILENNDIIIEFVKHKELQGLDRKAYSIFITAFALVSELERELLRERLNYAMAHGKRPGRPPCEIPVDLIQSLKRRGYKTKKAIYTYLVDHGYLRYKERGEEKVLSYHQFCRRLKELEMRKIL